ncbi:hypothetical protein GQ44DRAFT_702389 [Phaeosphaeriaceae sp. PMI808]|nr:hypothetical protein GQ44DRAFT_702389 [Phaeosphaeriaceae sp. PMI808]
MERLYKLDNKEIHRRSEEIRYAMNRLHNAEYSHGDLSISNIMENTQRQIILKDKLYS